MSFFVFGARQRLNNENQLLKLDQLIDWRSISALLTRVHKNDVDPLGGQKGYNNLSMFKAVLLGQWHSLSDAALEEAIRIRLDFILFTGLESPNETPDETTLCRFRNLLIEQGLDEKLFHEINAQLERHGLKIKKAEAAVVDATLISSAARPRQTLEPLAMDREEPAVTEQTTRCLVQESVDPDAKWLVKGKKAYFGYKAFVIADAEAGYIRSIHVTGANQSECTELPQLLAHVNAQRLLADKGYASKNNREALKACGIKDGIMHKATRGNPLRYSQKLFNRLISKKRFIIEQGFGTLKRRFHFSRASYMTRLKVAGQLRLKAMCFNLLKAINKVRFVPNAV